MKRNTMFFLSYIIFIFVCFVVKCFWDYPLWNIIVAAITTASCIFSIVDITEVVAVEYVKDDEEFEPLLQSALEKCNQLKTLYLKNGYQLVQKSESGDEMAKMLLEGPEVVDDVKRQLDEIVNNLNLKRNLSIFCKRATNPLLVFGYLSFFSIMVFEPINRIFIPIQDYLTVFAFGILMLTQYFGNYVKEEHMKLVDNYQKANSLLDELKKDMLHALEILK